MSMRDDVMKGKNFAGMFANDVEAHINGETTTLVFGELWPDGQATAFTKITIPTKLFAKLGLSAYGVMSFQNTKDFKQPSKVSRGKAKQR